MQSLQSKSILVHLRKACACVTDWFNDTKGKGPTSFLHTHTCVCAAHTHIETCTYAPMLEDALLHSTWTEKLGVASLFWSWVWVPSWYFRLVDWQSSGRQKTLSHTDTCWVPGTHSARQQCLPTTSLPTVTKTDQAWGGRPSRVW